MRYLGILIGLFCLLNNGQAQDSLAIYYGSTITAKELSNHLHIIAADDYEGRETGYLGQRMCEEYMVDFYKSLGLPPVKGSYTQEFELSLDDPKKVSVSQGAERFEFLEDFYYYPGTSDRVITGQVIFADYGISTQKYHEGSTLNIKNKIVLIWDGEPMTKDGNYLLTGTITPSIWSTDRNKKQETLGAQGAAAVMIIHENYASRKEQVKDYFSHMSMSLMTDKKKSEHAGMPVFHISTDMAASLIGEKAWKKIKKSKLKRRPIGKEGGHAEIAFTRSCEQLTSSNVMGYIEGTDLKDEVVIITAHYDHIGVAGEVVYNGADDDGSGTVATLEIAEAFAQAKAAGHGPRRSVMILNVSAEEKGLLGSRYYTENPVLPLANTVADLNIDMIGRVDEQHADNENYVYLIGADRLSQGLHDAIEKVNREYVDLELDYTFNALDDPNQFYYRSDHYNFAKNKVPSVFFFSGVHEDYHKPGDTVDKIMFPKLEKITRLIFHTAWELANSEKRIVVDKE